MRLKDKVAIVTGASKGIGAAIAKELALEGCNVAINYYSDEKGANDVNTFIEKNTKSKSLIVQGDIGNSRDAKKLISKTISTFKRIDILVNNAGIAIWKPFLEITEEIWDRTIKTNLKGPFLAAQLAAKEMLKNKIGGVIINISSLASQGAMDCLVPYCASKGGLTLLTKSMAVELAPYNIRVNAISAGTIDIDRNRITDPNYPDDWKPFIPMGRVGQVDDISKLLVFLCLDEASYITGQNIFVTGGQTDYIPMPRSDFAR